MRPQQLDIFAAAGFSGKRVALAGERGAMVSDLEFSDHGRDLERFPHGWWIVPGAVPGLALMVWAVAGLFG
jgi:hypothetical protein